MTEERTVTIKMSESIDNTVIALHARLKTAIDMISQGLEPTYIMAGNNSNYYVWLDIDPENYKLYNQDCEEFGSGKAFVRLSDRERFRVRHNILTGIEKFNDEKEIHKGLGDNWRANIYSKIVALDTVNRIVCFECQAKLYYKPYEAQEIQEEVLNETNAEF